MKAIVFRGPMDVRLEEVPGPTPGPGEIVVRVGAAGVCGSDIHAIASGTGRRKPGMILGHEGAGEVVAVGPPTAQSGTKSTGAGQDPIALGSRVAIQPIVSCGTCLYCQAAKNHLCLSRQIIGVNVMDAGTFAEYVRLPIRNAYALAPHVSDAEGAMAEPFAVGLHAARLAGVSPGSSVMIADSGPIGLCSLLAARHLGAKQVFITDLNPHKLALAEAMGGTPISLAGNSGQAVTDHGRDPSEQVLLEAVAQVKAATDGIGATHAIDAVGTTHSVSQCLQMTRPGAPIALVGLHRPRIDLSLYDLVTQERSLQGSYAYTAQDFADAVTLIGNGQVDVRPLIQIRKPLMEAESLILSLCKGESQVVKGVITRS